MGKTSNQQPPEKAKHLPKLPPTNNSEVNLPTYTSLPTLNLPPKTHFVSKKRFRNFQRPIFQSDSVFSITKRPSEGFPYAKLLETTSYLEPKLDVTKPWKNLAFGGSSKET